MMKLMIDLTARDWKSPATAREKEAVIITKPKKQKKQLVEHQRWSLEIKRVKNKVEDERKEVLRQKMLKKNRFKKEAVKRREVNWGFSERWWWCWDC
jgi:hypothetical protein